jgi:hypothetical protein
MVPNGVDEHLGLELFRNLTFYWNLTLYGLVLAMFMGGNHHYEESTQG